MTMSSNEGGGPSSDRVLVVNDKAHSIPVVGSVEVHNLITAAINSLPEVVVKGRDGSVQVEIAAQSTDLATKLQPPFPAPDKELRTYELAGAIADGSGNRPTQIRGYLRAVHNSCWWQISDLPDTTTNTQWINAAYVWRITT